MARRSQSWDISVLQVTDAAMDHLETLGRSAAAEIAAFDQGRVQSAQSGAENGPDTPACKADADYREAFRAAVTKTMDANKLDGFVYPTWSNPPRLIGDLNTPHGDNSQVLSPTTGYPAINVPMGYTRGNTLPAGVTFFGRGWDESALIRLAYGYEQATRHRKAPTR